MFLSISKAAPIFTILLAAQVFAELPPLLDRGVFFASWEILNAQISPDGQYIAFTQPFAGTRNIWIKKTNESYADARLLTEQKDRPILNLLWSRDARYVLFTMDDKGDENDNVYAVAVAERSTTPGRAPQARNLTNMKVVKAEILGLPLKRPDIVYVALNDRDKAWHDLYEVSISTRQRKLLHKNTERMTSYQSWVFDWNDRLRLATRVAENGDNEILDLESGKPIYTCTLFEQCYVAGFNKDNRRIYLRTNKGKERDLVELVLFDSAAQKEELVERDPHGRSDMDAAFFSDKTHELIETMYIDDYHLQYWTDKQRSADYRWLEQQLPRREFQFASHTADENSYLITTHADIDPGETYLFDRRKKTLTFQYRNADQLPSKYLAEQKIIRYRSSDGLEIPAYLTLPKGVEPKNLPTIVTPHGGPYWKDFSGYNDDTQFWANRGYAVLQMNFRGSLGYGKRFLDAGDREWGLKMQDDITWGVKYLVEQGIADPKRIGIAGGSYGGYATLAGIAFTPDLYAAAADLCGPSSLLTMLADRPVYWTAYRKQDEVRVGDINTPEGRSQLKRQSPLYSVGRMKTPLLVAQGANDARVKKTESDQIVAALYERGSAVEYLLADDEGHGFQKSVNSMAYLAEAEKFMAKYLGGRYQDSMPPDVKKRLGELQVDPKTLKRKELVSAVK